MRSAIVLAACLVPSLSLPQTPAASATAPPATVAPASPQSAPAATGALRRSYTFVGLGTAIPSSGDLKGWRGGFAWQAGAGVQIAPNLALEGGVGRFTMSYRGAGDPNAGTAFTEEDLSATQVTATVRLFGRSKPVTGAIQRAEGYLAMGVGGYFMSLDASGPGVTPASESDTSVGFNLGAGFGLYFAPRVSLGLDARYAMSDATFLLVSRSVDHVLVTGTLGIEF